MNINEERAYLASIDAHKLEALCRELRALDYEISSRGQDGKEQYQKVCDLAPGAIKSLVNYLPN